MQCDHQLLSEHMVDYIEGRLAAPLIKQMEDCLNTCSECQTTYRQCLELYQQAKDWTDESVPEWHRTSYAVRPPVRQSNWLNWGAMATSTFAILMVVFQLEINSDINGLHVSFGGNQSEQKVMQMVEAKLASYTQEQSKVLAKQVSNQLEKQDNLTQIKLAAWLEKNRDERQQDIKFVMTGWQNQRYQDQQTIGKELAYLADNQIENNQAINQLTRKVIVKKNHRLNNPSF